MTFAVFLPLTKIDSILEFIAGQWPDTTNTIRNQVLALSLGSTKDPIHQMAKCMTWKISCIFFITIYIGQDEKESFGEHLKLKEMVGEKGSIDFKLKVADAVTSELKGIARFLNTSLLSIR